MKRIIPIANGGTGATDKISARKNLGYLGMFFAESVNSAEVINIPSNANLNTTTYLSTGKYGCPSNWTVATLTNCPTGDAFQMLVINLLTSNSGPMTYDYEYRTRILMSFQGNVWVQLVSRDPGPVYNYGAWRKFTIS